MDTMDKLAIINNPNLATILSKPLCNTDKDHQLIMPTEILKLFPIEQGHEREFVAFDKNGKEWRFILAIRQTGDYGKPVLRKAIWHKFVEANGLSKNDGFEYGVLFYTEINDVEKKVQVRGVRKPLDKFFGKPLWALV